MEDIHNEGLSAEASLFLFNLVIFKCISWSGQMKNGCYVFKLEHITGENALNSSNKLT